VRLYRTAGVACAVAVAAGLIVADQPAVSAQTTSTYGLTIPAGHPRLWWNAERIERAKAWLEANPFTPVPEDGVGLAMRCLLTGEASDCQAAVAIAMNTVCKNKACNSSDPVAGVAADDARWEGENVILIYDWFYQHFSAEQRTTLIERWNTYFSNLRAHHWGGPPMVQSNYNWGYMRNEIEWGIATWGENPEADANLRHGLVDRWQDNIVPYWKTAGGRGGVFQEGSAYGSAIGEYSNVPFGSATLLGRDLYRETNFFREAVMYVIYATLPAPTFNVWNGMFFPEVFPFADDERFLDGGMPARSNYGGFMQAMADYWRDVPIGEYARRWVTTVNPVRARHITAVDRGGNERDFSTLPLDYFAAGARFMYTRNQWGPAATAVNLQLGATDDEGHRHNDSGSWQIWRNGRWLSRETTGYSNEIAGYGGATVDTNNFAAHNTLLVNGKGPAPSYQNGPSVMTRLESTPDYSYAAVDMTESYRATHPKLENPAVAYVEREFVFIRPLETLLIFDRVETYTATTPVTFLARFETQPQRETKHVVAAINGAEAIRVATLVPANPTYRPIVAEGGKVGQYRLEVETSGSKETHLLNVVQAKGAADPDLESTVIDRGSSYTVTLTHPTRGSATLTLQKDTDGSRGTIAVGGNTYTLTDRVAQVTVTDDGPVWGPGVEPPAPATGIAAVGSQITQALRTMRGSDSWPARIGRSLDHPGFFAKVAGGLLASFLLFRYVTYPALLWVLAKAHAPRPRRPARRRRRRSSVAESRPRTPSLEH
jgi:hypothetical protein